MKNETISLIELINKGKTCNEICSILNISNKQLYSRMTNLKNKGFFYNRKYYSNGIITYTPITAVSNNVYNVENTIITKNNENDLKCLLISDLHFGNLLDRIDLINKAFDYCIKENIHIILCCGDLIDGTFTKGIQKIENIYEQIDYFSKNYPFDKNILTFAVAGDHDYSALFFYHQNMIEMLKNYRHDIIISNYNNSFVNIKNDKIHLFHHIDNGTMIKSTSSIILHGHPHKYSIDFHDDKLHINVPSLSDINDSFPTALELNLKFKGGYFNIANIKQIYFDNIPLIISEFNYDLLRNKIVTLGNIKNIEPEINEQLILRK